MLKDWDKFKVHETKSRERRKKKISNSLTQYDWPLLGWSWLTENFTLTGVFRYNVEHVFRLHHLLVRRRKKDEKLMNWILFLFLSVWFEYSFVFGWASFHLRYDFSHSCGIGKLKHVKAYEKNREKSLEDFPRSRYGIFEVMLRARDSDTAKCVLRNWSNNIFFFFVWICFSIRTHKL